MRMLQDSAQMPVWACAGDGPLPKGVHAVKGGIEVMREEMREY